MPEFDYTEQQEAEANLDAYPPAPIYTKAELDQAVKDAWDAAIDVVGGLPADCWDGYISFERIKEALMNARDYKETVELLRSLPQRGLHACGDPDCIVPHPAPHKKPPNFPER